MLRDAMLILFSAICLSLIELLSMLQKRIEYSGNIFGTS
uniref:Uncharacterized protein n=1 Tax=Rhizophora mucronata TaxID=61149 RepID=A0A2P2IMX4_RHIMU